MCWYLTDDKNARFAVMFLMAMLGLFGFKQIGMSGGGTLAVLMMGTTIHNSLSEEELASVEKPVAGILGQAWSNCGAVLLFTLLGASLDASKLSPALVGMGVLLVILGLVGRSITLFFTLFLFPQWGVKEKLYSMISWCPNATVPVVLQYIDNAMVILTTAILSIIMTAPVFAVLMLQLAPRLLDDDAEEEECSTSV